ncbi:mannose-1-phosphate guanylyltransferase/mannose-6-phosphate isomerase [soil metagenome]
MDRRIQPVILAGGSGTRLWPVSRESFPKQFQPLTQSLSTYQQALLRVSSPDLFVRPIVITSREFRHFAVRQAKDAGVPVTVILEPMGRDSAGAIAAAAAFIGRLNPDAIVMALAADHVVLDDDLFVHAVRQGIAAAHNGHIVVFGLTPTEPKTSYGYIHPGAAFGEGSEVFEVAAFVEKPDLSTAQRYLREGYLWNSGNFLFRADVMIAGLSAHAPLVMEAAKAAVALAQEDAGVFTLDPDAFSKAPKTSIDYALIEKTKDVVVVKCRFRWSDVGAWDALWQLAERDAEGNAVRGPGHLIDSRNCLIYADGMVAAVSGADDLIVIATADAVMVTRQDRAQSVKDLVSHLKLAERPEASRHKRDYLAWGSEETINRGEAFAVRRLTLDPGGVLVPKDRSCGMLRWVVVEGMGTVRGEDQTDSSLTTGQSFELGPLMRCSLVNSGETLLEIIAIETGTD